MMTPHPGSETLIALRMGTLGGEESRELLNHIAACATCRRAAQEVLDLRADTGEVLASLAREDAAPRRPYRRYSLAAAAIIAAIALTLVLRERPSPPVEPRVVTATTTLPPSPAPPRAARRAPWDAIVRETIAAGAIAPPALLQSLQPASDEFRARSAEDVRVPAMDPFGEIVESDRPLFRWPKTAGATYTVLVGERGRLVAESGSLTVNSWRCDVALPRGRTYRWQIEIRTGDATTMMPMPPAPSARFHVLDAETKAQLDEARAANPGDHLLLGILYARAGLREEALAQFDAVAGDDARALRDSIRKW